MPMRAQTAKFDAGLLTHPDSVVIVKRQEELGGLIGGPRPLDLHPGVASWGARSEGQRTPSPGIDAVPRSSYRDCPSDGRLAR
jgi:hypothetical protein